MNVECKYCQNVDAVSVMQWCRAANLKVGYAFLREMGLACPDLGECFTYENPDPYFVSTDFVGLGMMMF